MVVRSIVIDRYGWNEAMAPTVVVAHEQHEGVNSNCKGCRVGWLLSIPLKALRKQLVTFIMFSESLRQEGPVGAPKILPPTLESR